MDTANAPQSALDALRTVEFKLGLKGYNVDDVDEFLERAAVEAEHLKDQLRQQQQQLRQAAERINQLEADRRNAAAVPAPEVQPAPAPAVVAPMAVVASPSTEQVTRMIGLAQQFVDQTQAEAEARAKELTLAAQDKAREIVSEAQSRAQDEVTRLNGLKQRLSEDVERLSRQIETERTRLRSQLGDFMRWIEDNLTPDASTAVLDKPAESAPRELVSAPAPTPLSVPPAPPVAPVATSPSTSTSSTSTSTPPLPSTPPPAPPRAAPTTIGQVLNFDTDERS